MNKLLDAVVSDRYGFFPNILPVHINIHLSNRIRRQPTIYEEFKKNSVLFTHMPKVAGSSIGEAILGHDRVGHYPVRYIKSLDPLFYEKAYKISIVRNPWDRLFSAYSFLMKGGKGPWDSGWSKKYGLQDSNFESFVMDFLDEEKRYSIIHLVPQIDFLTDVNEVLDVNYVGRMEEMHQFEAEVSKKLPDIKIGHANINPKKNYKAVYTKEMIIKVHELYQRDVEEFDYEF